MGEIKSKLFQRKSMIPVAYDTSHSFRHFFFFSPSQAMLSTLFLAYKSCLLSEKKKKKIFLIINLKF